MRGAITVALAVAAPSVVYSYRGADGAQHYVGQLDDVPPALRSAAEQVDLSGIHLNRKLEKDLEASSSAEAEARAPAAQPAPWWLPGVPLLGGLALVLAGVAAWLRRRYRKGPAEHERAWRAARATTWLAVGAVLLLCTRAALPHLGRWRAQLSHFGLDALIDEEGRNSDAMRKGLERAEKKAAGLDEPEPKAADRN